LKKNLSKLCYAICAVMLLCQLNACKDPVIADSGKAVNLAQLSLSHIDTCSVLINTVPDRPLLASGVSTGVLGSVDDLFFGNNFASIYAQSLLINGTPNSFANCVVDSAVLVMPYMSTAGLYGSCTKPIDISVYELSQDMVPGSTYYSGDAFSVYPTPIGQRLNYVADPVDSIFMLDPLAGQGGVGLEVPYHGQAPALRVRLSNNFANKLLNAPDSTLLASSTFIEYFKGLYITTNQHKVGNGYMYFALNSSGINLYYHHAGAIDTSVYQFSLSTYGVTVNHFDHFYGGTLVQQALSYPNPAGDKFGYVQAGGGTKLKVTIPGLKNLPTNIGVTKAELIMPILDTLISQPAYRPPSALTLYRIDDHDSTEVLNGNNASGAGYLTTRIDESGRSYVCYVFNITEYVQRVLNGYYSNNNGYYVAYSYTVRGDRTIILNDRSDLTKLARQCKLKITYTKLN